MTGSLEGKVALVPGASSGMGKASAMAFGSAGAKVVAAARRQTQIEDTVRTIRDSGGDAIFLQTDVTQPDQVEAMVTNTVAEFARLDFAFNNAADNEGGGTVIWQPVPGLPSASRSGETLRPANYVDGTVRRQVDNTQLIESEAVLAGLR